MPDVEFVGGHGLTPSAQPFKLVNGFAMTIETVGDDDNRETD
jgi:hypothetical protein